jgi:hypothetical protein
VNAQTPAERVNNRELLHRTIIRIRKDLARASHLAELIGINEPTPPEVTAALETLDRWTRELVRTGRRIGSPGRPPRPPTNSAS